MSLKIHFKKSDMPLKISLKGVLQQRKTISGKKKEMQKINYIRKYKYLGIYVNTFCTAKQYQLCFLQFKTSVELLFLTTLTQKVGYGVKELQCSKIPKGNKSMHQDLRFPIDKLIIRLLYFSRDILLNIFCGVLLSVYYIFFPLCFFKQFDIMKQRR